MREGIGETASRATLGAALIMLACAVPAAAKPVQIACTGAGAAPASFLLDEDAKTVSGTEGGAYTVPAQFTPQSITWTHKFPVGNPNNIVTQTWSLNRVTGWLTVTEPSNLAWTCTVAEKKF